MLLRAILVGSFVLLATVHVVRTAVIDAFAEQKPAAAESIWSSHPDMLRTVAMAEVGQAAGQGRAPTSATLQRLEQLARVEPLASEPLLVHSAMAQRSGDLQRAERLLVQARERAPRSAAARFLLADLYFRSGRIIPGLAEMSVLGRLIPGAMEQVAPALAAYASSAGAAPHLRRILLVYPELEPALLDQLAEDPRNADLILALASPGTSLESPARWQEKLLGKLVEQGAYGRAYSVWSRLSQIDPQDERGLFNPGFDRVDAPAPFNWTLASSGSGVAEAGGGGLRILYYGRDDAVLASQLMLLPAGRYRLEMNVAGQTGEGREVAWTVTCLPSNSNVLELPVGQRQGGGRGMGEFGVPAAGCAAQRLELKGIGQEFPKTVDFRLSGLSLTRIGG